MNQVIIKTTYQNLGFYQRRKIEIYSIKWLLLEKKKTPFKG